MLKATLPLRGTKVTIVVTTEPFLALQTNIPGAHGGLEQWRNSLGVNVPLPRSVSIEAGYLNRTIFRRNAPDRMDHIIPITLLYRF